MSMPFIPPPPPQLMPLTPQHSYTTHGSIGPVIGVLAVVLFLSVVAVMIGRLCSGSGFVGRGHYDMESWVETKFSSCVDGRVILSPPRQQPPPPPPLAASNEAAAATETATSNEGVGQGAEEFPGRSAS